jgi:rhodanese-related sulfurtransferase
MFKHVTVEEAHQQQDGGSIYLDVRSVPEYQQAHPAGAYNVPLLHLDPSTRQMRPNPDFVKVMKANFPADSVLLVGCQAGARSLQACDVLAAAGFRNVANVLGGFGGSQTGDTGWMQAGLPVETAPDAARQYDALQKKTDEGR